MIGFAGMMCMINSLDRRGVPHTHQAKKKA
jgi:hypothetical protein